MPRKGTTEVKKGKKGRTGPKRTHMQIRRDRRVVADLYCKSWYQYQIAEHLSKTYYDDPTGRYVTEEMVANDVKAIMEKWESEQRYDITQWKRQELAKCERLEQEAWKAWVESQRDLTTKGHKQKVDSNGQKIGDKVEWGEVKQTSGDPRYLAQVQDCHLRRAKLLGLDEPKRSKLDIDGVTPVVVKGFDEASLEKLPTDKLEQLEAIMGEMLTKEDPNES